MARKRHSAEEIVNKLRQAEVEFENLSDFLCFLSEWSQGCPEAAETIVAT